MASAADLLKCSLCLSEFKDPRALPCLHTFCLDCLIDLSDTNRQAGTLKCPVCQEHHKMPQNGAVGFRKDFRINSFMEINRNKEQSVRTTMCKWHPKMELTHFCEERGCNRAVLCTQCAAQSHKNHLVHPIKSICEEKLGQIKMMKQVAQLNRDIIVDGNRKFDQNTCAMLDKVQTQIEGFHFKLDQLEKKITDDVKNKIWAEYAWIIQHDYQLEDIQSRLERLEAEFSGTVPNIVQTNADKHLEMEFQCLQESLSNWSFSYSLPKLQLDTLQTAFDFTLAMKCSFVEIMPRQNVKVPSVSFIRRTAQAVKAEKIAPVAMVLPVEAKEIVAWKQRDDNVRSIVCHSYGGIGVTIVSSSHLRVYKQNEGEMFHSSKHNKYDDEAYQVTTFRGRCHAVLSRHGVQLFYNWPISVYQADQRTYVQGKLDCGISGTENYLVYSAWENATNSQIVCLSVRKYPPEFPCVPIEILWQRKFGPITPRSLSALELGNKLLVVVASGSSSERKKATALIAVNGPANHLWKITFEALDREAEEFDLRDMCNDGRYFYVLNTKKGCVHVISTDGVVLSKILHNLDRPRSLACNSERKELVVASSGGAVKVYKLVYKGSQ